MRTLKKSLALVLALVMLLGLGVVGASADNALDNYTDADEIGDAYLEAVGVLTGLGIVDGMTETTIVPQATYTRAQAAKIITTMVLGVNGAKSCVASYAPFDDVAANHWAAGYIAFCKEQGIIDGVTDTTFDPEGTLTGYQWAKMLLAAVGFNANNELEGSSWSLNTARIGREVGLFDGDLAGADHTPLRREQAMLYAFNTLSGIRQVTYTANGDNYVYGIWGYEWADGTGYTLGQAVFGLEGYTGIIVANEGTGADYTEISANYTTAKTLKVAADTGVDMFYHAVRAWYVLDDKGTIGKSDDENVAVYVYDLAKVTESTCKAIDKAQSDNKSKVVASKSLGNGTYEYDYYFIDNTAYAAKSYADVTVMYNNVTELGVVNPVANTVTVGTTTVKTDKIWTDISNIAKFSKVIYTNINGIYYIYPVSATTGTVDKLSAANGTVTLTDGTVLSQSVFYTQPELYTDDGAKLVVGNTYTFVLDTHGHIISITREGVADLYYYTKEFKVSSSFNDTYHGEFAYTAQFINVTTGEYVDLPVSSDFILTHDNDGKVTGLREAGFYDLGVANDNGLYVPGSLAQGSDYKFNPGTPVTETLNVYAGSYVVSTNGETIKSGDTYTSIDGKVVFFDTNVKFIIASGSGTGVTVKEYASLAELMNAYHASSINFDMLAVTTYYSDSTKTLSGSVVFGFIGSMTANGQYLFLPDTFDGAKYYDTVKAGSDVDYLYNNFYLNGVKQDVKTDTPLKGTQVAGFYTYTINEDGDWKLTRVENDDFGYTGFANVFSTNTGNLFIKDGDDIIPAVAEPVIVDCRAGIPRCLQDQHH